MTYLDRIFGRLGVKVNHDADRIGFLGDRLPDYDELAFMLAAMRPDPIQYVEGGKRLNIITTSTPAKAADPAEVPAVDQADTPRETLRAKWRRLKCEADALKVKR